MKKVKPSAMLKAITVFSISCMFCLIFFSGCNSELEVRDHHILKNEQTVNILSDTINKKLIKVNWKENGYLVAQSDSQVDSIFIHPIDSIVTKNELELLNNKIISDSFFVHLSNMDELTGYSKHLYSYSGDEKVIVFPIIDGSWNVQLILLKVEPTLSFLSTLYSRLNETGALVINDSLLTFATKSQYVPEVDGSSRTLNGYLLNDIYSSKQKNVKDLLLYSKEFWSKPNDSNEIIYLNSESFFQNTAFHIMNDSIISEIIEITSKSYEPSRVTFISSEIKEN